MIWRFWKKPVPVQHPIPFPKWSGLTLDQWRASDTRIQFATKLLSSRMGQDMMSVLVATLPIPDISDTTRAGLEAARVRGYMQAIAVILQMQVPMPTVAAMPEPTYDTTVEQAMAVGDED